MAETVRIEKVEKAFKIFLELVRRGHLNGSTPELFAAGKNDAEVQDLLANVIEPLAEVKILETPDRFYLSPNTDNKFFGYTNEELRSRMKLDNNKQLYLAYLVMLCLMAQFFGTDAMDEVTRSYVTVSDLEEFITAKLQGLGQAENLKELEDELEYIFVSSIELWQDLPEYDQSLKQLRRSKNNRISFILRVAAFLQEENLAVVYADREIHVTEKMQVMVTRYYADSARKEKLLALIRRQEGAE